ncbi:MAG TPA: M15 family metallopeptidase [Intrasporangium sp.]|nr:M15 family metallopeptidase [Intrasporangium sp.]
MSLGATMLMAGALVPAGAATPAALDQRSQLISTSDPIRAVIKTVTSADVRYTWRAGCPVGPASLRKVEMDYRTYDGRTKRGVLIVRASHASAVAAIFRDAYRHGFRINRMDNPNLWYGNDEKMMAADNTSAFNCRRVTGNSSRLSPHSYGKAIDVNPRRNPYKAANGVWYPPNGYRWINRSLRDPGMLFRWSAMTKNIINRGGTWGGFWRYPDYQHFELR